MRMFKWVALVAASLSLPSYGQSDPAELSAAQQVVVGGTTGAVTATAVQPLLYAKNCLQQSKSMSLNPRVWYRGWGAFAGSLTPVSAVQVSTEAALAAQLNQPLSDLQKMAVASAAGAASSVVASPGELTMLHQQNTGKSLVSTLVGLVKKGAVLRGAGATAGREAGFTMGYSALVPLLKKQAEKYTDNAVVAQTTGSVAAGLLTTVMTHPFDVVKTAVQRDVNREQYRNAFDAAYKLYRAEGLKAFTAGVVPRGSAVMLAVAGMGGCKQYVTKKMSEYNEVVRS